MFVFPDTFVPTTTLWPTQPDSSVVLLSIGVGLVLFLIALVIVAHRRTRRAQVACPALGRTAHVTFHLDDDGAPVDVMDCDLANGTTGTSCQRACLPGRR